MVRRGQDLTDDNARKASFHGFDLLETFDFEADVREDFSDLFGRKIGVDITFEPVIRNIHGRINYFLKSSKDKYFSAKRGNTSYNSHEQKKKASGLLLRGLNVDP